jgi:hypothetical protein
MIEEYVSHGENLLLWSGPPEGVGLWDKKLTALKYTVNNKIYFMVIFYYLDAVYDSATTVAG